MSVGTGSASLSPAARRGGRSGASEAELAPRETRLIQLADELPRLQAEADLLRIQYLSRDEIIHEAQDLYRHWADLTGEEKRQLVEAIVARIMIGKDEVIIELCYLPPPTPPLENVVTRAHNRRGSHRRTLPVPPGCHRG